MQQICCPWWERQKRHTTTNIVKHLEACNHDNYREYLKKKDEEDTKSKDKKQANPLRQLCLEDRIKLWDINNPRARKVHQRIGEMIALDTHPFSIVDVGFTCLLHCLEPRYQLLSRKYITYTVIPKIKAGIDVEVKKKTACVKSMSLTTDTIHGVLT